MVRTGASGSGRRPRPTPAPPEAGNAAMTHTQMPGKASRRPGTAVRGRFGQSPPHRGCLLIDRDRWRTAGAGPLLQNRGQAAIQVSPPPSSDRVRVRVQSGRDAFVGQAIRRPQQDAGTPPDSGTWTMKAEQPTQTASLVGCEGYRFSRLHISQHAAESRSYATVLLKSPASARLAHSDSPLRDFYGPFAGPLYGQVLRRCRLLSHRDRMVIRTTQKVLAICTEFMIHPPGCLRRGRVHPG